MGACASKHNVLKGVEGEVPAPVPLPELTKEPVPRPNKAADVVAEGENKVEPDDVHEVVKANDVDKAREVVNDDEVVDQVKENEKEGSAESNSTSSEITKSASLGTEQQESAKPVKTESLEEAVQIKSVEPVTQELLEPEKLAPSSDAEKLKETIVTMNQETEEPSKPIEHELESAAPGQIESAQSIEAKPAPEAAAAASGNDHKTENKETILKYLFSFI